MKDMARAYLIRTIHHYGRARAAGDFAFNDQKLSSGEAVHRIEQIACMSERIDQYIADELRTLTISVALVSRISEFSVQLFMYGTRRYLGEGPAAAQEVIEALDWLLDASHAARMKQARERAA